ncbi:MAG: replication-associated recombination protein A [Opitutaceae bacterium]|nr:replication-associated recombination protein A [Cytophagales bacterium]
MQPLAERMRPKTLDDFVGQPHLTGEKGVLRKMIANKNVPSLIFWGPPGVGKTTLAQLIAENLDIPFFTLSAISSGVKEVREIIEKARYNPRTLLFIDEIHRFNKTQQDALLGAVEKGIITLVGATTENPSFEVVSALLSRCQVYVLNSLDELNLRLLLDRALEQDKIIKEKNLKLKEFGAFYSLSGGDGRKLLNLLELVASSVDPLTELTDVLVTEIVQRNIAIYDKNGEQHYDVISAFIKSIRGSDPNAALYWLARMIEGGEDVSFIARRLLILSSEDIGNANPNALLIATSCFQAVNMIGYPESEIILAQTVTYLATSVKSNASYLGIKKAKKLVQEAGYQPVPLALRNAPTGLMKKQGYGSGYMYSHDFEGNFAEQEFLPEKLSGTILFDPGNNPRENEMRQRLKHLWAKRYKY